jgi:hypothetical protein
LEEFTKDNVAEAKDFQDTQNALGATGQATGFYTVNARTHVLRWLTLEGLTRMMDEGVRVLRSGLMFILHYPVAASGMHRRNDGSDAVCATMLTVENCLRPSITAMARSTDQGDAIIIAEGVDTVPVVADATFCSEGGTLSKNAGEMRRNAVQYAENTHPRVMWVAAGKTQTPECLAQLELSPETDCSADYEHAGTFSGSTAYHGSIVHELPSDCAVVATPHPCVKTRAQDAAHQCHLLTSAVAKKQPQIVASLSPEDMQLPVVDQLFQSEPPDMQAQIIVHTAAISEYLRACETISAAHAAAIQTAVSHLTTDYLRGELESEVTAQQMMLALNGDVAAQELQFTSARRHRRLGREIAAQRTARPRDLTEFGKVLAEQQPDASQPVDAEAAAVIHRAFCNTNVRASVSNEGVLKKLLQRGVAGAESISRGAMQIEQQILAAEDEGVHDTRRTRAVAEKARGGALGSWQQQNPGASRAEAWRQSPQDLSAAHGQNVLVGSWMSANPDASRAEAMQQSPEDLSAAHGQMQPHRDEAFVVASGGRSLRQTRLMSPEDRSAEEAKALRAKRRETDIKRGHSKGIYQPRAPRPPATCIPGKQTGAIVAPVSSSQFRQAYHRILVGAYSTLLNVTQCICRRERRLLNSPLERTATVFTSGTKHANTSKKRFG